MTENKQLVAHFWVPRTFEKLEKGWKNLFFSNIASWGPTGWKNIKSSILGIFFEIWPKWLKIFKIFDIFYFLYQPWTIHFCNKNFEFFFLEKLPNFGGFLWVFQNVPIKFDRAKTAAGSGRTGWCLLKSEKSPKFVKFRRFFTNFSNFLIFIFVPTMNDLILV